MMQFNRLHTPDEINRRNIDKRMHYQKVHFDAIMKFQNVSGRNDDFNKEVISNMISLFIDFNTSVISNIIYDGKHNMRARRPLHPE